MPDRVSCAAALACLAPYNAKGLDWNGGMADSNIRAYHNAEADLAGLVAQLDEQAVQVRNDPESLLRSLWPELGEDDKSVVGDIGLRRLIAETHAEALRRTVGGWVDDVLALRRPWGFDLSAITVPMLLWHGNGDVFSPASHTYWLARQIPGAEIDMESGRAHFGAVEAQPQVLAWVAAQMTAGPAAKSAASQRASAAAR